MRLSAMRFAAITVLLLSVSCNQVPMATDQSAAPANPLEGVWSVEEIETTDPDGNTTSFQAQPSQFIFTASHYSSVHNPGEAPRPPAAERWNPTAEEKVAEYDSIIVNTGTYELSGSQLTVRPVIAKSPEFVGGHMTFEYQIEGDQLTLQPVELVSMDGVANELEREVLRLRRVE